LIFLGADFTSLLSSFFGGRFFGVKVRNLSLLGGILTVVISKNLIFFYFSIIRSSDVWFV
jgi:hypothetical protein